MATEPADTVPVALHRDGLDDAQAAAAAEALARAGLPVAGDAEAAVTVTGSVVAAVKLLAGDRPIVCLADAPDRARVAELLGAGASGVVPLAEADGALGPAVRAVAAGLVVVPGAARAAASRPVLTNREKQILGFVVLGLTNAEIGKRLFLAESTVKYHLLSVYGKLGVRTRKEAADLVLDKRNGLDVGVLGLGAAGRKRGGGGYSEPSVS